MKHDDLVDIAREWLLKSVKEHPSCPVVITEMSSACREIPDAIGWYNGRSILVECKAYESDYKADQKKYFRRQVEMGLGDHRYYMAPDGLIDPESLPEKWGLLEVNDKGRVTTVRRSENFEISVDNERKLLLSLIRRLDIVPGGNHIKIKVYTIDDGGEPRATATFIDLDSKKQKGC